MDYQKMTQGLGWCITRHNRTDQQILLVISAKVVLSQGKRAMQLNDSSIVICFSFW